LWTPNLDGERERLVRHALAILLVSIVMGSERIEGATNLVLQHSFNLSSSLGPELASGGRRYIGKRQTWLSMVYSITSESIGIG